MLQRGTQPTAPSRQVHWYLQLLWKDSPLRYTMPPKTHGAPSRAARSRRRRVRRAGAGSEAGPQPRLPPSPAPSPAGPRPRPRSRPGRRRPRPPLTGADADPAVGGGAEVAEEPLVVVAGVALGAELAQLLGADAAAAAAVGHQRDAGGAGGAGPRAALALPAALLALRLLQAAGERGGDRERGASGPPPGPRRPGRGRRGRGRRHLPG